MVIVVIVRTRRIHHQRCPGDQDRGGHGEARAKNQKTSKPVRISPDKVTQAAGVDGEQAKHEKNAKTGASERVHQEHLMKGQPVQRTTCQIANLLFR